MFADELYISIAGAHAYFGMEPFQVSSLFMLPDNLYDSEAITVIAPVLGHDEHADRV